MSARCWLFYAALVLSGPALAQGTGAPPTESVTVTGIKNMPAAIGKFVDSMTAPTRVAGKLARWKGGVCPITVGLPPELAQRLTKRVKDVAAQVGAPVNGKEPCPHNIEIIFTAEPQALLDNVRIMHPVLLGYYDNSIEAERLATSNRPIQSWYSTATVDMRGNVQVDGARKGGVTMTLVIPPAGFGGPATAPNTVELNMPNAIVTSVTGNRLGDGISSALSNVMIIADTGKLLGRDMASMGDIIAMLALAQVQAPDSCQELPSVLNLLVPGCSQTSNALTSSDLAYLRALYKITTTAAFRGQRREMTYQMNQMLGAGQ
jgi:hypothetical protein